MITRDKLEAFLVLTGHAVANFFPIRICSPGTDFCLNLSDTLYVTDAVFFQNQDDPDTGYLVTDTLLAEVSLQDLGGFSNWSLGNVLDLNSLGLAEVVNIPGEFPKASLVYTVKELHI